MATATKLTNLQQELLKIFSVDISDAELKEVKEMLVKYFAILINKKYNINILWIRYI